MKEDSKLFLEAVLTALYTILSIYVTWLRRRTCDLFEESHISSVTGQRNNPDKHH